VTPDEELKILRADWAALVAQVTGAESRRAGDLRRGETFTNSGGEAMLTDQQLQRLRNQANECEQAADEIVELRAERDALRACGYESIAMYRRCRDERDALVAASGATHDCAVGHVAALRAERDALLRLLNDAAGVLESGALRCDNLHHPHNMRHDYGEPCPVEGATQKLRSRIDAALAKEAK